jgi:energy-coupling factor transport system permease protein
VDGSGLHPVSWLVWTVIVAAIAILTRNPLYLGILFGIAILQYASASRDRPDAQGWRALWRLAAGMALLIIPFNALTVHVGSYVLFELPAAWPAIGGAITLEAILWGCISALSLLTLLTLFAAFNLRVDQAQILRLTPSFIYEAGLIVSIAVAFVPQMVLSAREIREAQRIRGHRMRRLRDMLPFVIALLTTGLERSFQLAESIEARGFGRARDLPRGRDLLYKGLTLLGLAGLPIGILAVSYSEALTGIGWAVTLVSVGTLVSVFWAEGQRVQRTHYRRDRWTWRDGIVLAASACVVVILIAARARDPEVLYYYPYVELLPPFEPWIGTALLALVTPVLLASGSGAPEMGNAKREA